jgi:hypothetical protein
MFSQNAQWVFSQVRHLVKLDKAKYLIKMIKCFLIQWDIYKLEEAKCLIKMTNGF